MTPTDVASSRSDPKTAMYTEADQHIGKIPSEPDGLQSDDGTTDNGSHPDVTEQRIDDKCREGTSADQSGDNNPTKKLTTLADLIHVCRDRGLQVFNDKPNRPEADKLWLKARTGVILGHRPADRTPSPPTRGRRNGHQSVSSGHTRPTRSRHSKHSRRSKKSNKREEKSRTSYADSFSTGRHDYGTERSYNDSDSNSIHRKTSTLRSVRRHAHASSSGHRSSAILRHDTLTVGSTRYRMSATSRHETLTRSSVLSILELYDDNADIDAEEVLKLRMRRKSKRRKENPVTMDEILQQKQQEIKTLSPQQQSTDDETGEKDTKGGIEITGVSTDNDSTRQGQSRGVNSLHSLITQTPRHVSVVNNNDKSTESESAQGHSDNTPLEEKERFDDRHHIGREIDKNTMVLCENTQHAIETTAFMNGASVLPSNDQRSSKSSGVISQSTLSHSKDFTSSDSLNDESNINEDATSHQSQSAPTVTNDPIYDGSEIINEKIIVQRIMNEMSSHENYNNENISEEQITGNNDSPKTTNDNITRSSPDIDAFKGDELHESVFTGYISRCEQERGSMFLNFDSQTEETSCLEGSCKSQSDSRPFSGERIFNNSSDVKSDKKSHISNVEQQPAIDEHLKFQGVAIIETTTNKERTIKTVDNSVEDDAGAKKNDNVSDEIKLSVNEKTKQTIAISLDADNLIVEKQYLAGETSQDSNSKIMETTYDNRNYNSKSEDNVPKMSYGNGFLVSADVHTSGGIPDKNSHGGDKNDNNKNSSNADQNESKLESMESKSSVRQQSVSTLSKSGSQSTSTSSAATPLRKVHGAARLMLLMSQLKKSYQDEEKTQQSFLQEIGITRKSLRSNYRKMQLGEDIQIESPKHDTESGYDTSVKDDDSDLNDKECKHADPDILDKVDEDQTDDLEKDVQTESHDETNVNENIQDEEIVSEQKSVNQKIFSEPLSENVKKAKSKIDTRWNRDGIIYKQIKTGFKSKAEITDSSKVAKELKKLRQSNSTTGNSQAYNVYMEDVHQRYMQSLQNQAKTRNEFSNIQHSKKVSRPKTERVNTHKVDEQLSERPHTDGHRSQSPNRNITAFEGNTDKPKHTNQNGRIANVHRPKQKIQKGGIDSRIPVRTSPYEKPKVRMKESETDRDFARLERDKKITNGYQDYMDNQETLPNIEGPGRKTFNTNRLTNNRRANANSTRAMKLKGMEFSTNGGYADNDSHNIGQSPKNEKTPKQLENHKVFHVNETINKHVDGLDSRGESVQSHAGSSKSTTSSRRSKIPIGKAVEIMQTRNKFYEEAAVEKDIPREMRVLKLFEELQKLKYGQYSTPVPPSDNGLACSSVSMGTRSPTDTVSMETNSRTELRKFLMMDYGLSDILLKYRSNFHLNRFLHEAVDYEMCSRGRPLYRQTNRKEKAFENLRQKFYPNTFSVSHEAR